MRGYRTCAVQSNILSSKTFLDSQNNRSKYLIYALCSV
jgi:hypothetical protein